MTRPGKLRQLREAYPDWDAERLTDISSLHEVRNQAQHHGVVPSIEEAARWPADVDRFIRALISASLGLELADVYSYMVIENLRLRELLEQAELALDGRDAKRSFNASWSALSEARREWGRQRARFGRRIAPARFGPLADTVSKELQAGLASVEEFVEIATFAADFGEFVWFAAQNEESQHRTPPSLDDARRALVFTVIWISRWETFSARFPEKRWESWTHQPTPTVESDHDRPVTWARLKRGWRTDTHTASSWPTSRHPTKLSSTK